MSWSPILLYDTAVNYHLVPTMFNFFVALDFLKTLSESRVHRRVRREPERACFPAAPDSPALPEVRYAGEETTTLATAE